MAPDSAVGTRPSNARQSLYYLLGAALQGTGALVVQPFSIRLLSPLEWGRVGVSIVLLQIGQVVLSAGLPLAISRAYFEQSEGPSKARAIHGANIMLGTGLAAIAALGYLAAAPDKEGAGAFAWALAATGFLSVVVSSQALLRSQHRALSFVLLSGGASLGAHLGGLVGILAFGRTAAVYLASFTAVMVATAVVSLILTRPSLPWRQRPAVAAAFRLGLPVLPHSIAIVLLLQGDTFLVQNFQGASSVGRYVAAAAFALGPFAILAGLNNVWTTRIFEAAHGPNLVANVRAVGREVALLAAALGVCGTAAATIGMLILKGPDHEATQLAKVLPGVAVGYALYLVGMSTLFAVGRTKALAWATPLVVVVAAGLAWFPAQSSQYWELGAVRVLVFALLGALYAVLALREAPHSIALRSFMGALALVAVAIAVNLLLPTTLLVGTITLVVGLALAGTAFLAVRRRGLASSATDPASPTP
ncbi:lipopolysaccharide biosynthesis protein [Sinomonas susongensis]|uniref:lipopolysaccharide biosynthesis protein n=1 Tax=Sinomonas susongensis TaxID=1324851 RepID=UPI0011099543|nr:oligosaccharide flippase family protein [Sinomonas susongensis]